MTQAMNDIKCKIHTKSCVTDYQKWKKWDFFFLGRRDGDHLTGEMTSEYGERLWEQRLPTRACTIRTVQVEHEWEAGMAEADGWKGLDASGEIPTPGGLLGEGQKRPKCSAQIRSFRTLQVCSSYLSLTEGFLVNLVYPYLVYQFFMHASLSYTFCFAFIKKFKIYSLYIYV